MDIQKGMIAAALDLNMQVVELQHGSFNREHLAYSYPSWVHRSVYVIFPQFVLTLGQFWGTGMNIPALKVVPIGNNCFVPDHSPVENDGSILFISSMIHGNDLAEVARNFQRNILINQFILNSTRMNIKMNMCIWNYLRIIQT